MGERMTSVKIKWKPTTEECIKNARLTEISLQVYFRTG